jgi:hypothetical protein
MMGLMKRYFSYAIASPVCGLPSVTLLGVKADYENIREKVKMLTHFGDEPSQYQKRLSPIMNRIIRSFNAPSSIDVRDFWTNIVHTNVIPGVKAGCTMSPTQWQISGWITGFHFWDEEGQVLGNRGGTNYSLDGVSYLIRDQNQLPVGYSTVPVALRPLGQPSTNATVVAGVIGKRISSGPPVGYIEALNELNSTLPTLLQSSSGIIHSQLQPSSAWLMYSARKTYGEKQPFRNGDAEIGRLQQFMQCPNNFAEFAWGASHGAK